MLAPVRSWRPTPTQLRRAFLGALVMNTVIVVTGGAVRLTASGLGCPTVPKCTEDSMVVTREMGVHGAIEFGNRLMTFALAAAVLAALLAAWRARRRDLVGLAALLFLGIVAQAVLGAVTVLTGLNPVTVMAHFLVSMALIAVAVVGHARATGGGPAALAGVRREIRAGAWLLTAAVAVTLFLGTVVTGTGPHSGDKNASHRLPFDLESVSQLHADGVFLVLGLALGLLVAVRAAEAPRPVPRRMAVLLGVVLAQGLVGYVQYLTDLPVALVMAHVLGACLVWIATLRVLVASQSPAASAASGASAAGSHPEPAWADSR
jgi:cytochrome c oxidase assembly protein subunit 15